MREEETKAEKIVQILTLIWLENTGQNNTQRIVP